MVKPKLVDVESGLLAVLRSSVLRPEIGPCNSRWSKRDSWNAALVEVMVE